MLRLRLVVGVNPWCRDLAVLPAKIGKQQVACEGFGQPLIPWQVLNSQGLAANQFLSSRQRSAHPSNPNKFSDPYRNFRGQVLPIVEIYWPTERSANCGCVVPT